MGIVHVALTGPVSLKKQEEEDREGVWIWEMAQDPIFLLFPSLCLFSTARVLSVQTA